MPNDTERPSLWLRILYALHLKRKRPTAAQCLAVKAALNAVMDFRIRHLYEDQSETRLLNWLAKHEKENRHAK